MNQSDDRPSRAELIEARDNIRRQLEIVEYPARSIDRSPQLIAKLQAMLDEINALLGEEDPGSA